MGEFYRRRYLDERLEYVLPHFPAVAIEGMRGVGKSTTAGQHARTIYNLEKDAPLAALRADVSEIESQPSPVFIDEWQRFPPVWDAVRQAVDAGAAGGSFLLSGSAGLEPGITTHTGAGRIVSLRMRPMTLEERQVVTPTVRLSELFTGSSQIAGKTEWRAADYAEAIVRTGLPGLSQIPLDLLPQALDSYIYRSVDVEMADQNLPQRSVDSLRAWLRSYAGYVSTDAGYNEILDAATPGQGDKPQARTAASYRDRLAGLWILDPLPAWALPGSASSASQLKTSPVHHLADPGLAARILDLNVDDLLLPESGLVFGRLFESLACLCVRAGAELLGWKVGHLRTRGGSHEVDLVVQQSATKIVGIEVKLAREIGDDDVKHLLWLREKLGSACKDLIVLTAGGVAYRREDGIAVVPLALLGL